MANAYRSKKMTGAYGCVSYLIAGAGQLRGDFTGFPFDPQQSELL